MLRSPPHLLGAAALLAAVGPLPAGDPEAFLRERMVREQIENRGIRDRGVLRVLRAIPRHLFVPSGLRSAAYDDCALPIGYGSTISQPYIVALMTELLSPDPRHRVLEIGTGSGYQAALLSQLARHVYSMEIVPQLADSARRTLTDLGYANVTVRHGDGYRGWPEEAPFDRIIVTAAPPEIPQTLIDQLALRGRLVAPVGEGWGQDLIVLEKKADGSLRRTVSAPVIFIPMRHGAQ